MNIRLTTGTFRPGATTLLLPTTRSINTWRRSDKSSSCGRKCPTTASARGDSEQLSNLSQLNTTRAFVRARLSVIHAPLVCTPEYVVIRAPHKKWDEHPHTHTHCAELWREMFLHELNPRHLSERENEDDFPGISTTVPPRTPTLHTCVQEVHDHGEGLRGA